MAMSNPCLSLRFTIFLFVSVAFSSFSFSFIKALSCPSPSIPTATLSDLLSLLGSPSQSSYVNPLVANELKSCFKFLVPFIPFSSEQYPRFEPLPDQCPLHETQTLIEEENKLIWWPPEPVIELARLAVDSGGDPGSIHPALDPIVLHVPDVEGSKENKCELTETHSCRRFINQELNSYLENLFKLIVGKGPDVGLEVSLNRYDLFHGHLFIVRETGRLGILFHAREYPAYDEEVFPVNMGYCQEGSNMTYDDLMNLRNILWLSPLPSNSMTGRMTPGVLVVLDARPDGIIYKDIIPEDVKFFRTIYEDDLGKPVVDVNYLNIGDSQPDYQIFICGEDGS